MDTVFRNRNKSCVKCSNELINATGVHMGIPFAHHPSNPKLIVCGKCYDDMMVDEHKTQRTGEDVV